MVVSRIQGTSLCILTSPPHLPLEHHGCVIVLVLCLRRGELDSQNTFTILCAKETTREAYAGVSEQDSPGNGVEETANPMEYESMISRFVNALHGSVDMPAQYMATVTLGLPLEYTSHTCENLLTHQSVRAANSVLRAVDPGTTRRDSDDERRCASDNESSKDDSANSSDFGAVTTDGKGGSVVVGPLDDYRHRVAKTHQTDKAVLIENLSMVQFALGVYKARRRGNETATGIEDPFRFVLHSDHPQASGHVLVFRRDRRKRVFVFLGPTARPETPEAFAQFILLFFKPWHGANGIQSLLHHLDRTQPPYKTWTTALAAWTLESRQTIDPLWYANADGDISHPYIDNIIQMFQGEDRAREMAIAMKRLTREERLELVEFRGNASGDEDGEFLEGDADYARVAGHRGVKHYRPAPNLGRPLRSSIEKEIVGQRVKALTDNLLTKARVKALCGKVRSSACEVQQCSTPASDGKFDLDPTGKLSFRGETESITSSDAAREWQSELQTLAERAQASEVDRANAALTGSAVTEEADLRSITESVVDLTGGCTGRPASVSACAGRYVPRGVLVDGAPHDDMSTLFQGPSLAEIAMKYTCNPRQALGLYVAGKSHIARLQPVETSATIRGETIIIRGEPGVGKSRIATAFLEWAELNRVGHSVVGGSATGKAGSNIGLPTIHRSANIQFCEKNKKGGGKENGDTSRKGKPSSTPRDLQLKRILEPARTYVNDECSLTRATLLWDLSEHLNKLRQVAPDKAQIFGNLNLLMIGDFYQKIGMNLPVYGPQICAGDTGTEKMSKASIDKANKGRRLYEQGVKTISLVEQVRASSDKSFQRLNRHVRYGTGTDSMARELNNRSLQDVSDKEKDELFETLLAEYDANNPGARGCILALRHAVLDQYDQLLMPLFAKRHRRRLVKMPSNDSVVTTLWKQYNGTQRACRVSKLPVADWLNELMGEFPTVLTASKCGKVAKCFDFVVGASYRLTIGQKYANLFGGCNGCLAVAIGFLPHDEEPEMPESLGDDDPWVLEHQPKCILLRLHDIRLLAGKRVGNLPEGVIPWYPDTVTFTVEPGKLNGVWTRTQRALGQKIADGYVIRRSGLSPKPAMTNTDVSLRY